MMNEISDNLLRKVQQICRYISVLAVNTNKNLYNLCRFIPRQFIVLNTFFLLKYAVTSNSFYIL